MQKRPVEIITWVEQYKTLFTGELTFHGMHNIYSFRGAKVRDALNWTKYLTEMKLAYGDRISGNNIISLSTCMGHRYNRRVSDFPAR